MELSSTTLPYADRNGYAVYNYDVNPDCIFTFGGWGSNRLKFYCYNITSNEIYNYYNMSYSGAYTRSNGAFFIEETLYFFDTNARIISMDVANKVETIVATPGVPGGTDSCMAQYPDDLKDDIFYFITPTSNTGYSNNRFYYYNTTSNQLVQGPELNVNISRFVPSCITHDDYLYVFGGGFKFERINLIDFHNNPSDTEWELINSFDYDNVVCSDGGTLTMDNVYLYDVTWKNYIFLVGNTFGYGDRVGMFDTDRQELFCSKAEFSTNGRSHLAAAIGGNVGNERLYTFGGFSGGADVDYIFISNNLTDFTSSPTFLPTGMV